MPETVQACPQCGTFGLEDADDGWWCSHCESGVTDPDHRRAPTPAESRYGLAKRLVEADPDAVGSGT